MAGRRKNHTVNGSKSRFTTPADPAPKASPSVNSNTTPRPQQTTASIGSITMPPAPTTPDIDSIPPIRARSPVPFWIYAPSYIIERDEDRVPTEDESEQLSDNSDDNLDNLDKKNNNHKKKKKRRRRSIGNSSASAPSVASGNVVASGSTDIPASSLNATKVPVTNTSAIKEYTAELVYDTDPHYKQVKKKHGILFSVSFSLFLVSVSMFLVTIFLTCTVPAGGPSAASSTIGMTTCPLNNFTDYSHLINRSLHYTTVYGSYVYDDGESSFLFDGVPALPVATPAPVSPSVPSKPVFTPEPALATPKIFFGPVNRNMSTGNSSANTSYTVSSPAKHTTVRPTLHLQRPFQFRKPIHLVDNAEHQGPSESANVTTGQQEIASPFIARPGFFQNLRDELEDHATPALVKLMSTPRKLLEQCARLRPRYLVDNTLGDTTLLPNRWRLEVGPLFGYNYGCYARSADLEEEDSVATLKAMSSETLLVQQIESANDKMLSDHIETLQKRTEDLTAKLVACETPSESRRPVKKRPCVRRPRQKQVKAQSLRYLYDRNRMHKQTCDAVYEPKPESSIETRPSVALPISSPTKTFYNFAVPPAPSVSSFLFLNIRFSVNQHAQLIATVSELSLLQVVYAMEHLLLLCFIAAFLSCKWPKRNRLPVSDDYHAITATDSPTANLSAPMMSSIDAASLSTTIEGNASVDDALPSTTIEGNLGVDFVERASSVEEPLTSDDSDTGESSVPMKAVEAVHDALPSTTIEDNAGVHDLSSITVEAIGGIDVAEQDPSVGEPLTSDEDELMEFPETAGQLTHKKTRRAKRAGKKRVQDRRCARELREAEKNAQDLALTVAIESRLHVM